MVQVGDEFRHKFKRTKLDVYLFACVSGDMNPIHLDEEAGRQSQFGRCIMHGMLASSVFTKIFGSLLHADGHVYLRQDIKWLKPMFAEVEYEAVVTVKEIYIDKHRVLYDCAIMEPETGQKTVSGEALLLNEKKYIW